MIHGRNTEVNLKRWAILLFLVVTPLSLLLAQGVTPAHIAQMKLVNAAVISPDGQYVAYSLSVPADPVRENRPNTNQLHVFNTETGESRPYFTSSGVGRIAFRPGHGTITFLSRSTGDRTNALYEVHLSGGEAQKIYSSDNNITNYSWHPKGHSIVYTMRDAGGEPASPLAYQPEIFEEGMQHTRAYISNIHNPEVERIRVNTEGTIHQISWSHTGEKLAVSATPSPSVDDSYMKQQVRVIDPSTGNQLAVINNQGKLGQIEWSPSGDRLALRAGQDLHDPIDGRILIVSASGGTPRIIDAGFQGKYEQISWTAEETIHFRASESTATSLGTIHPDGSRKQVFYRTDDQHITSFSRADNGHMALVVNTPQHPAEMYTLRPGADETPLKRTDHNPWLHGMELGKQTVVRYPARDGQFDIEGLLIYPLNYREGTRVPLITVVHGGPEAHYSNGWLTTYSVPGQMAAAKGYAVFYPNYRGSTGRGIEFIYSSQGDLSGKEFDDVVDGVDYLIEQGIADGNRIGVTGGSYGGYASAWMSTYYSERFAAAVMFVGISNNISKWGTSDIPEELYLVHSRKRLWDDWMDQLKRSPIYYVDRAQTPILIMHGSNDTRVHPAQSMELYRHLKVRKPDVPARLVFYPGEGHGNQRSGSRYDYNLRMLQWFDTYLMTGDAGAPLPSADLPAIE